jgi:hypothetical protein
VLWLAGAGVLAQSVSVTPAGGVLRVRAPGLRFIEGEAQRRLKDGRSLRFDLAIEVLAAPRGGAFATGRERCTVSYDLWDERFAASRAGTPRLSVTHLDPRQAEAWCVEQVAVPLEPLTARGREDPFWVRVGYRAEDPGSAPDAEGGGLTIWSLIDMLGRRPRSQALQGTVEAGPFRLPG